MSQKNKTSPIYVTKSFLPPKEEYIGYLNQIWDSNQLTNNGPLTKQLEQNLADFCKVKANNLRIVANGTIALQLSLNALGITDGEIITTPFSYVATTSAILWERCDPVFVDIDPETFNIDPLMIESAITPRTKAILPVHVFGNPCNIDLIERIAKKHNLKVIYDAAHAFGIEYNGKSIFEYGDISICSFHSTKLFHTIEGGLVYAKNVDIVEKAELAKKFGHIGDDHMQLGINGKASEFNAAMGLANLKYANDIIKDRKRASLKYDELIGDGYRRQSISKNTLYNYSYYPIVFNDEEELLRVKGSLEAKNIFPRRYFYPSLNNLPYLKKRQSCPNSEYLARRILCLPLFYGIEDTQMEIVCGLLNS